MPDEPNEPIDEPRPEGEPTGETPGEPADRPDEIERSVAAAPLADSPSGPSDEETAALSETLAAMPPNEDSPLAPAAEPVLDREPAQTRGEEEQPEPIHPPEAIAEAEVQEIEAAAEPAVEPASEAAAPPPAAAPAPKPARRGAKAAAVEPPADTGPKSDKMDWYILKVQSNREESIREGLLRRIAIAGLRQYFGDIIIPTEKVTEFKGGKKRVMKRKLYPGYIVVQMEVNEETWFMVRETPGIGDFTGAAGAPTPMLPHEVSRILARAEEKPDEAPKLKIGFHVGDRVKVREGNFENFEGEVHTIDETNGRVTVMINIFGRSTPVELEYWQIEAI